MVIHLSSKHVDERKNNHCKGKGVNGFLLEKKLCYFMPQTRFGLSKKLHSPTTQLLLPDFNRLIRCKYVWLDIKVKRNKIRPRRILKMGGSFTKNYNLLLIFSR